MPWESPWPNFPECGMSGNAKKDYSGEGDTSPAFHVQRVARSSPEEIKGDWGCFTNKPRVEIPVLRVRRIACRFYPCKAPLAGLQMGAVVPSLPCLPSMISLSGEQSARLSAHV